MSKPQVGEQIRLTDVYGENEHTCTVVDLLNVQLRATYESSLKSGGWREHSMFAFYSNVEWDTARQVWKGKAG